MKYGCEGCGHGYSMHSKSNDKCKFNKQSVYGTVVYKCPCLHYVGDTPVDLSQFNS